MNIRLFCLWGIGILVAVGLSGCASLAPRQVRTAPVTNEAPAVSAFVHPLPGSRVISAFGKRGRRMHEGVDLLKSHKGGDIVVAARAGIVEMARRCRGYGLTVLLLHPDGSRTRYAHLKKLLVTKRQRVAACQRIGTVGSTGRSTRPHLHYEVLTSLNRFVDPSPYLQSTVQTGQPARRGAKAAGKSYN